MSRQTFERPLAETTGESEPHPNLDILTFTGVDRLTPVDEVFALHDRYPKVEFGLLVGADPAQHSNRFPSLFLVESWRDLAGQKGLPLSIHLCGDFSKAIMAGEARELVLPLVAGFSRVQINARRYDPERVAEFADAVDCPKVILQRRGPISPDQALNHPKVEYLLDNSGGRGRETLSDWDAPSGDFERCGYSGGLRLKNIDQALEFVSRFRNQKLWLDMESGVRTEDDWFDLDQVAKVCARVYPDR